MENFNLEKLPLEARMALKKKWILEGDLISPKLGKEDQLQHVIDVLMSCSSYNKDLPEDDVDPVVFAVWVAQNCAYRPNRQILSLADFLLEKGLLGPNFQILSEKVDAWIEQFNSEMPSEDGHPEWSYLRPYHRREVIRYYEELIEEQDESDPMDQIDFNLFGSEF